MRQVHSQIIEGQQLRNTAEDYEYRNGEIHHATTQRLAYHLHPQWLAA